MKVIIEIEQFDNGIALKWKDEDDNELKSVALERDKEQAIGKMIWEDIKSEMDYNTCNKVELKIEYEACEEN